MNDIESLINELADLCGIIPSYWDNFGTCHVASLETKRAILRAMGRKVETAESILREIDTLRSHPWNCFLDPVFVVSHRSQPLTIPLHLPVNETEVRLLSVHWRLNDEEGATFEQTTHGDRLHIAERHTVEGTNYLKILLRDTAERPLGYYSLTVRCHRSQGSFPDGTRVIEGRSRVIIAPDACYLPEEDGSFRTWGLAVNLYAVRSRKNWGIGDLGDLKDLLRWIGRLGGGYVGINPLHGTANRRPAGISPYSAESRLYKSFLYVDTASLPDVGNGPGEPAHGLPSGAPKDLGSLKKKPLIDYERIAPLKEQCLRQAFERFHTAHYIGKTSRGRDFRRFVGSEGKSLEHYALFNALRRHFASERGVFSWQEWPAEFRRPDQPAVRRFRKGHEKEVLFHQYVQWLLDSQLRQAAEEARKQGMPIGIYHDLAIGAVGSGPDAWMFQDVIGQGLSVGAPPDDFNPNGQCWGFPPLIPERLRQDGYDLFIRTVRANMRHCGALRIDHALGMFRIFCVPDGVEAKDGAYVTFPTEDLLRIIALESVRNRTMVIAEDLGTIGDNVRETLRKFNMLSYRLLYFERNYPDPSFVLPDRYPELALCAVTTHDLPTCRGFWSGHDITIKEELGLYRSPELFQRQLDERARDRQLLMTALRSAGVLPADFPSDTGSSPSMADDLCLALYEYLARTPCLLVAVSLDDIIGTMDQQNMPGVTDSYPSWIRKTPLSLETIFRDRRFRELSGKFKRLGRSHLSS